MYFPTPKPFAREYPWIMKWWELLVVLIIKLEQQIVFEYKKSKSMCNLIIPSLGSTKPQRSHPGVHLEMKFS